MQTSISTSGMRWQEMIPESGTHVLHASSQVTERNTGEIGRKGEKNISLPLKILVVGLRIRSSEYLLSIYMLFQ